MYLITEPDRENPIVHELMKIDKVQVQSSTVADDFATLMSARNVALSGVGTFCNGSSLMFDSYKEPIYYGFIIDRASKLYYDV